MDYILSVDLGTTAIKVALFDTDGEVRSKFAEEYTLKTPTPLSVELPVETYWQAFRKAVSETLASADVPRNLIRAIGISAQGETMVVVDKEGRALCDAIVWLDNRAQDEAETLTREFPREVTYRVTGQVSIVPTWPASKILWIREHQPQVFANAHKFLLLEDYFIHRLTGEYVAEGSLLTSTVYWDFNTKKWWSDMLRYLQVDEEQLPEILESGRPVGTIRPTVAQELGLSDDTQICTGALDQAAGAIGVGNTKPGIFSENTGAALAICATVDHPVIDPTGRMPCHYHAIADAYMEHTFTTGGMVLRWYRDHFCQPEMEVARQKGIDAYDLIAEAASKVAAGSDGLVVLPHLQGAMAPEDNPKAKGVFFGLTLMHSRAHFTRAIMESIGFIVRRNIEVIEDLGIPVNEIRCLGGGARSAVWNQIKADITGRRVVAMVNEEAACLGAAIIAGVGVGIFDSVESACARMVRIKQSFEPQDKNREIYDEAFQKYVGLYGSLVEMFAT